MTVQSKAAHLHRARTSGVRSLAQAGMRPEALEESETSRRVRELLEGVESHLKRANKLLRDAEADVRQMRRAVT